MSLFEAHATRDTAARRGGATLYGLAVRARNAAFRRGLVPIRRVEGIGVISVGNLRAGGSGKTPLAILLAQELENDGLPTCLVLRGYRGSLEHRGGEVSRGTGHLVSAREAGDEAFMAARRLEGVAVRVGKDRLQSVVRARDDGARIAVLDDGFQHRRLHRDLDILLVCPEDLSRTTALLPAGPLREPPNAAARAHLTAGLADDWEGVADPPPVLLRYEPTHFERAGRAERLEDYRGRRAHLLAGTARPERFARTAREAGLDVTGTSFFGDHHRFSPGELAKVSEAARAGSAELIVTTEKDSCRIDPDAFGSALASLVVEASIHTGASLLRGHLARVAAGVGASFAAPGGG